MWLFFFFLAKAEYKICPHTEVCLTFQALAFQAFWGVQSVRFNPKEISVFMPVYPASLYPTRKAR